MLADTAECSGRDVADVRSEAVGREERVEAAHQPVADDLRDDRRGRDRGAALVPVDDGDVLRGDGPSRKPSTRQTSAGGVSARSAARRPFKLQTWSPSRSIRAGENACTLIRSAQPTTAWKSSSRCSCVSCFESLAARAGAPSHREGHRSRAGRRPRAGARRAIRGRPRRRRPRSGRRCAGRS